MYESERRVPASGEIEEALHFRGVRHARQQQAEAEQQPAYE
ncbi:hypothetical protein QFZ91_000576 [Paraburkholderia sp. JPY419]